MDNSQAVEEPGISLPLLARSYCLTQQVPSEYAAGPRNAAGDKQDDTRSTSASPSFGVQTGSQLPQQMNKLVQNARRDRPLSSTSVQSFPLKDKFASFKLQKE